MSALLEERFARFLRRAVPNCDASTRTVLRIAFYNGAGNMFDVAVGAESPDDPAAIVLRRQQLMDEMEAFVESERARLGLGKVGGS